LDVDGVGLFEVPDDADGVSATRVPVMDPTRTTATVTFDDVAATAIPTRASFLSRLRAAGWAALSAEQVGAARAVLDATVQYTQERKQFGRVIGAFQARKHRMADLYVEAGAAPAKGQCPGAPPWITGEAIQLHGGVAITCEYDTHLFFKRAHGTAQLLGQPHELLAALETAAGL